MRPDQLLLLDLTLGPLATTAWVAAVFVPKRWWVPTAVLAALATAARVVLFVLLAGHGWWFARDRLTIGLPLIVGSAILAAVVVRPGRGRSPAVVTALLSCAYSAGASVFVSTILGYPGTLAAGLIVTAAVVGGTLATWRRSFPGFRPVVAATVVCGLTGVGLAFVPAPTVDNGGGVALAHAHHGTPVSALRGATEPAPGGRVHEFELTAKAATVTLASGRQVEAWTYNGQVPGPPIEVNLGDLVKVKLRNENIEPGVTIHWHGLDVPAAEDGAPGMTQEAVPPGGEHEYRFRAEQVGTYWYHTHEVSDEGVRKGLYGTLIVKAGKEEVDLTVPVHTFGSTVVIGDDDGIVRRDVPAGARVRLRLINTDSSPHRFTVAGTAYRITAVDGTDLNGPTDLERVGLRLAAGGRYDVVFTMPSTPVALLVDDNSKAGLRLGGDLAQDTGGWPEWDLLGYGTPLPSPFGAPDRSFTMVLDRGLAGFQYAHTVNGRAFPNVPTQMVAEGDTVELTVVNRATETHPWHLHGHKVLILSRDGQPVTGSPLWMDTFDVRPGQVWRVVFRADNPGLWMNHCHNLAHADQGMVLHLAYAGVVAEFSGH